MFAAAALLAAAAIPTMAAAQDAAAPAPAKKADDPNRKICRKDQDAGSHFMTSTCHTAAQWAQIDRANQSDVEDQMRDRRSDPR